MHILAASAGDEPQKWFSGFLAIVVTSNPPLEPLLELPLLLPPPSAAAHAETPSKQLCLLSIVMHSAIDPLAQGMHILAASALDDPQK